MPWSSFILIGMVLLLAGHSWRQQMSMWLESCSWLILGSDAGASARVGVAGSWVSVDAVQTRLDFERWTTELMAACPEEPGLAESLDGLSEELTHRAQIEPGLSSGAIGPEDERGFSGRMMAALRRLRANGGLL